MAAPTANSFRLHPNAPCGGDMVTFRIEGLSGDFIKHKDNVTKCSIELFEARTGDHQGDPIATFDLEIVQLTEGEDAEHGLQSVKRTDKLGKPLPRPKKRETVHGFDFDRNDPPQWIPPHFFVKFLMGADKPQIFLIHIPENTEIEAKDYIHEIVFIIREGGAEKATSKGCAMHVDCNNLLAHNCQQAALTMMNDHRQLVNDPSRTHSIEYTPGGGGAGCGIYYGSEIHKLLPKYLAYLDGTLAPGDRDYKVVQREMDQALSSYSREVLRTYLAQRNTALNADITKFGLKPNNCVFYQMDATETGHEQSNAKGVWTKIHDRYEKAEKLKEHGHGPGGTGDQLFKGFEDAGWVGIYYNPDICNPFDKFTQPENATHHINSYKTWISTGQYTHLPAPVGIINYDPTLRYQAANEARKDGSGDLVDTLTNMDTSQLDKLANVPYGVLIARDAYHTALIILGKVYEVHWEKFPDDPNLFAATDLKDWDWLDGMLMVPKGFWT